MQKTLRNWRRIKYPAASIINIPFTFIVKPAAPDVTTPVPDDPNEVGVAQII